MTRAGHGGRFRRLRCARRAGAGRRGHDQPAARAQHAAQRHPERAASDRAEQPGRDRAGQGKARRAARAGHGTSLQPAPRPRRERNLRLADLAQALIDSTQTLPVQTAAARPRTGRESPGRTPARPAPHPQGCQEEGADEDCYADSRPFTTTPTMPSAIAAITSSRKRAITIYSVALAVTDGLEAAHRQHPAGT